jgi:hypothetical protein
MGMRKESQERKNLAIAAVRGVDVVQTTDFTMPQDVNLIVYFLLSRV